jgi:hypothetical protein
MLLVLTLTGCAGRQSEHWERQDDRSPPGMSETSDCRFQARRQAEIQYPDRPREQAGRFPGYDDRRFPAELAFYEECMRRKGFVRMNATTPAG